MSVLTAALLILILKTSLSKQCTEIET